MFTMLLSNAEGRAFLEDSKLLREIAFNLDALDPVEPPIRRTDGRAPEHMENPSSQNKH